MEQGNGRTMRRRTLLRGATAAAALTATRFFVNRRLFATTHAYRTEHVVFLLYSGGVRTYETWDEPSNIPEQWALRSSGALHRAVVAPSNAHETAKMASICGSRARTYDRRDHRNDNPTLHEYVRKQLDVPASECWHVAESGGVNVLLNHSRHPDYGARYAANFVSPDVFRAGFRAELQRLADLLPRGAEEEEAVARLRASVDATAGPTAADFAIGNTTEERARIASFLVRRAASGYSGTEDEQALKIAMDLIDDFRPRVLGITLNTHDVGHGSFRDYVSRVRESDALVGRLWRKIQEPGNPMRDRTTLVIVPEHGRDEQPNEQGGVDHDRFSDPSTRLVALFAIGPDVRQGVDLTASAPNVRVLQVVPTLARLLGAETPHVDPGIAPFDGLLSAS